MIQKIKRTIMIALAGFTLMAPALVVGAGSTVYAANNITKNLCQGANEASGTGGSNCKVSGGGEGSLKDIAQKIVNIFSLIVGMVAIIMIIYGGFRYITSGGDSGNVGTAKNTLIYAIVGLIIVALAQLIVRYVLDTAGEATTNL